MIKEYFCDNPKCDAHILVPPHVDTMTLPKAICHNEFRKRKRWFWVNSDYGTKVEKNFCDCCTEVLNITAEIRNR